MGNTNHLKNNIKLFSVLTFIFVFISCKNTAPKNSKNNTQKPNIVIILVDDLGWKDLGYTGSTFYESPNIDVLSEKSVQFPNAYSSSPVCSPARASILTGKHPSTLNITDWIPGDDPQNQELIGPKDYNQLPLEEYTLAEVLKENHYTTFFAGKWHLGGSNFTPEHQGFDVNIGGGHYGQPPGGYYSPYKNDKIMDGPEGEYLTDRLTSETISFINKNSEKPFFVLLSFYSVHTPIQPNKTHIEKFEDKLAQIPNHDIKKANLGNNTVSRLDQYNPEYASMVYAMDENVGKLIKALKAQGVYNNTIIVFTSDNGGLSTLQKSTRNNSPTAPTSVAPLKAGKGWLYEGGLKVPLLIKPVNFNKTKTIETSVVGSDIFPTVLAMADIKNTRTNRIDGKDLSPLLKGKNINRNALFWHYPHYHGSGWTPGSSIKKDNWKLIALYSENTFELYNLSTDPYETNNVILQFPEIANDLKQELLKHKEETNSKIPTVNPNFKESTY
ncbi:MAG: sulfatase [Flavobacteriaceae bacterium]